MILVFTLGSTAIESRKVRVNDIVIANKCKEEEKELGKMKQKQ